VVVVGVTETEIKEGMMIFIDGHVKSNGRDLTDLGVRVARVDFELASSFPSATRHTSWCHLYGVIQEGELE
jgi:hypothetical protein